MGVRGPNAHPVLQTPEAKASRAYNALAAWRKAEGARYGVQLDGRRIAKLRRLIAALSEEELEAVENSELLAKVPGATLAEIAQAYDEEAAELRAMLAELERW
jgi:hypothetical protein